eukprot:9361399-Alexandrium_andersonii.AAC.1
MPSAPHLALNLQPVVIRLFVPGIPVAPMREALLNVCWEQAMKHDPGTLGSIANSGAAPAAW